MSCMQLNGVYSYKVGEGGRIPAKRIYVKYTILEVLGNICSLRNVVKIGGFDYRDKGITYKCSPPTLILTY